MLRPKPFSHAEQPQRDRLFQKAAERPGKLRRGGVSRLPRKSRTLRNAGHQVDRRPLRRVGPLAGSEEPHFSGGLGQNSIGIAFEPQDQVAARAGVAKDRRRSSKWKVATSHTGPAPVGRRGEGCGATGAGGVKLLFEPFAARRADRTAAFLRPRAAEATARRSQQFSGAAQQTAANRDGREDGHSGYFRCR